MSNKTLQDVRKTFKDFFKTDKFLFTVAIKTYF